MGLIGFAWGFVLLLTQLLDVSWEHIVLISASTFLMVEGLREIMHRHDK